MAILLGKRKRRVHAKAASPAESESDVCANEETARTLFQRAFEAKFKPLEKNIDPVQQSDRDDLDDERDEELESDWSGLSGDEDAIEIVQHATPELRRQDDILSSKKSFMSSKPPLSEGAVKSSRKPAKATATDDEGTEAANLKNDLDLQRLLKESHLLGASSYGTSSTPEGKGRLKALDMRLQGLGAKSSILQQEQMPISHRKGIASKHASREANRRREAAENGIILETMQAGAKAQKRRARGLGGPGIGKFKGGTLKLSSRDVASIQGTRSGGRMGRKGSKR